MSKASDPSNNRENESDNKVAAEKLLPSSSVNLASSATPAPEHTLTPEEQMALYEKELKENDWGHQPC